MGNIVEFNTRKEVTSQTEINEALIRGLETLLEDAKNGEFTNMAFVCVRKDFTVATGKFRSEEDNIFELIGATYHLLQYLYKAEIDES